VEGQELEQSRHAPAIPLGGVRQEFTRFAPSGQVVNAKKLAVMPAVTQQAPKKNSQEVKKQEVKEEPMGPEAGKNPEIKKPQEKKLEKKLDEEKKAIWVEMVAAPQVTKEQPKQRQQQQGEKKKKGDGFQEVKRGRQKRRVTFKRDTRLPLSQKKVLDILLEVNEELFEVKVPHFVRIQGVAKNI